MRNIKKVICTIIASSLFISLGCDNNENNYTPPKDRYHIGNDSPSPQSSESTNRYIKIKIPDLYNDNDFNPKQSLVGKRVEFEALTLGPFGEKSFGCGDKGGLLIHDLVGNGVYSYQGAEHEVCCVMNNKSELPNGSYNAKSWQGRKVKVKGITKLIDDVDIKQIVLSSCNIISLQDKASKIDVTCKWEEKKLKKYGVQYMGNLDCKEMLKNCSFSDLDEYSAHNICLAKFGLSQAKTKNCRGLLGLINMSNCRGDRNDMYRKHSYPHELIWPDIAP